MLIRIGEHAIVEARDIQRIMKYDSNEGFNVHLYNGDKIFVATSKEQCEKLMLDTMKEINKWRGL